MQRIEEYKNRLATLSIEECDSLATCRALQQGLRKLKREVLAQILTLRSRARRESREAMETEPSLMNLWKQRREIVDDLVDNVKEQLTGNSDDEDVEALEAWAEINREIDDRLEHLDDLEERLAKVAGVDVARRPAVSARPRAITSSSEDDDLYAAVGAEAQKKRRGTKS